MEGGGETGPDRDIARLLGPESEGLDRAIAESSDRLDGMGLDETVQLYYRAMSVSSMIGALRSGRAGGGGDELEDRIRSVEEGILGRFNRQVHPSIMSSLADSVKLQTMRLRESGSGAGRPQRGEIEGQAGLFDALRETMSTLEFVRQYDRGLGND